MSWIYLDKPAGIRSIESLRIVKKHIKVKCGIWGILDEFACGLLPIATESTTKEIHKYNYEVQKEYIFTVQLGIATDTGDSTGQVIKESSIIPDYCSIVNILNKFIGNISQKPPIFSNILVNGVRSHQLARQGKQFQLPSRLVNIYDLKIINYNYDQVTFSTWVGSGTYIRSLAQDISESLNTVGHLIYLRRNSIKIQDKIIIPTIDLFFFQKQLNKKDNLLKILN
jgi:tRNA pseudouridine55 synthase